MAWPKAGFDITPLSNISPRFARGVGSAAHKPDDFSDVWTRRVPLTRVTAT